MLKVNDIVRVREDLKVGACGNNSVVLDMLNYRGRVGCLTHVKGEYLELDIDDGKWMWNKEMLELISGFRLGEKVIIREDLKPDTEYGGVDVIDGMMPYLGMIATIKYVDEDGDVALDIDNEHHAWSMEMLEPVEECVNQIDYEAEYKRLKEDIVEYEGIVASLEDDLLTANIEIKQLRGEYNSLVDEYNSLVDDYNNVINSL